MTPNGRSLTECVRHSFFDAFGVGDVDAEGAKDVTQIKGVHVVSLVVLVEDDKRIFGL